MKRSILLIGWFGLDGLSQNSFTAVRGRQSVLRNRPCDAKAPQLPPGCPPGISGDRWAWADAGNSRTFAKDRPGPYRRHHRRRYGFPADPSRQHRIRISGIDAPNRPSPGQRAKSNLALPAFDREASAECRTHRQFRRPAGTDQWPGFGSSSYAPGWLGGIGRPRWKKRPGKGKNTSGPHSRPRPSGSGCGRIRTDRTLELAAVDRIGGIALSLGGLEVPNRQAGYALPGTNDCVAWRDLLAAIQSALGTMLNSQMFGNLASCSARFVPFPCRES